jgi:hypothetical protein
VTGHDGAEDGLEIPHQADARPARATIRRAIAMSTQDQQPLARTVGRRKNRDGRPLTPADRAALTRNAGYRTRAPKGVYIYYSAADMDADRLRWTVDAVVARHR